MNNDLLQKVIDRCDKKNLNAFFYSVSKSFHEIDDDLSIYDEADKFSGFQPVGEMSLGQAENVVIVTADIKSNLTNRSGKKDQYEKAKKILKAYMKYDAGIFVFIVTL